MAALLCCTHTRSHTHRKVTRLDCKPLTHQPSHPLMHIIIHQQITLQQRRDKEMSVFPDKTSAVHNEENDNQPGWLSTTQGGKNSGTASLLNIVKCLFRVFDASPQRGQRSGSAAGPGQIQCLAQEHFSIAYHAPLHVFILLQWLCSISIYSTLTYIN